MNAIANAVRTMDVSAWKIEGGICSGLAMRHAVLALVFTAGYNILGQLGLLDSAGLSLVLRWKSLGQIPLHLGIASLAILAAVAAENTLKSDAAQWLRYPAAVLIATMAGGALIELFTPPVAERGSKVLAALAQLGDVQLFVAAKRLMSTLYICTLVVALYVVLETNHRASLALHAARLRALLAQRDVCAAELSAMQARVDPELLFESLRLVDEAYASDPALGQARLDALIRFLRAALPGMSTATLTVRLEKELIEAYVGLVAPDGRLPGQPFFQANTELLDEAVPPMILLPMVRWALTNASADSLRIVVERRDTPSTATLSLTVGNHSPGPAGTQDDVFQIVSERLECLYGTAVRVRATDNNGQRLAVIEFPAAARNCGASPSWSGVSTQRDLETGH